MYLYLPDTPYTSRKNIIWRLSGGVVEYESMGKNKGRAGRVC